MKYEQLNIFGSKRIEFNEQIQLTLDSLNYYGPQHKHWAIAWSWGKDSTTLVTLTVQLILTGQIQAPESLTILCADTRMELIPLWISAREIIHKLTEMGINVKLVMAPIDKRFMVYILGTGVPPPSNTFRWCTGMIKIEPMETALQELYNVTGEKILMLTGVRQGESAIRDGRIAMSCSRDGAECGQGWYQTGLDSDICSTLAPILHWRVCSVWDWLKVFAPSKEFGEWPTTILADAYGGDEAEEINARTGCIGCPLTDKDKALDYIVKVPEWQYLKPLKQLKKIYRQMRKPQFRLRKNGEFRKDGSLGKNQQRLGPLSIDARRMFFEQILDIQHQVNTDAKQLNRPKIDILNDEECARIRQMIDDNVWPKGWSGNEIGGDVFLDKLYNDGSTMKSLFDLNVSAPLR
jgi:DNA sulfur modification protein DndC